MAGRHGIKLLTAPLLYTLVGMTHNAKEIVASVGMGSVKNEQRTVVCYTLVHVLDYCQEHDSSSPGSMLTCNAVLTGGTCNTCAHYAYSCTRCTAACQFPTAQAVWVQGCRKNSQRHKHLYTLRHRNE